ncbi:protein GVQW3-like [Galleria mellonella]|uniref:Protein GVQW3-like n=1 Tax=Galleria mellonella TaxID=7137 RepID=A0ABM3MWJ3_GALME|nr:protein GVQW3-like [Galleria mellonella]
MEPASVEEQRVVIKFLSKLGKNGREIFADLRTVYGDDAVKEPTVHKWLKRFREGRESVQDDPRSGRPSTSHSDENVERIRTCVNGDRRLTVRQVAEELNLGKTVVHEILRNELQMKKICAKIVP